MLGAVHVHPGLTVPLAVAVAFCLAWFWQSLGGPDVPVSRRRIRRTSVVLMAAAVPAFVCALSFYDPKLQQHAYVLAWVLALILMLLIILTAVIDVFNNIAVHREAKREAAVDAAADLIAAAKAANAARTGGSSETSHEADAVRPDHESESGDETAWEDARRTEAADDRSDMP